MNIRFITQLDLLRLANIVYFRFYYIIDMNLRANFLMHSLFEGLGVDNCPDFAIVVGGPEGSGHLSAGFAGVHSGRKT